MEEMKVIPIDDLMDASIDDLADLPKFELPPMGHYKFSVSLAQKKVNEKKSIEATLVVDETLELANKDEQPVEAGSKFSALFNMENEWGQASFKEFVTPIAKALGYKSVGDAIRQCQNVKIAAVLKHRVHKEDREKPAEEQRKYPNLKDITPV
jgi:hypothetical protein